MTTTRFPRSPAHAFTLIELLICIAVVAIISTSLIAFIVQPAREMLVSQADLEQHGGAALLFRVLAEDAHGAATVRTGEREGTIAFVPPENAERTAAVVYYLDEENRLRRAVLENDELEVFLGRSEPPTPPPGSSLLDGVTAWEVEPLEDAARWHFRVRAERNVLQQAHVVDKEARFALGRPWLQRNGGTP